MKKSEKSYWKNYWTEKFTFPLFLFIIAIGIFAIGISITQNNFNSIFEIVKISTTVSGILIALKIFSYSDMLMKLPKRPKHHQIKLLYLSTQVIREFSLALFSGILTILFYFIPINISFLILVRFFLTTIIFVFHLSYLFLSYIWLLKLINYPEKIYPKQFKKFDEKYNP